MKPPAPRRPARSLRAMLGPVLAYYARPNRFTAAPELAWLAEGMGDRLEDAFARVKAVLVHPVDARRLRVDARRGGVSAKLDHALHTTAASILQDERLRAARAHPALATPPAERLVLSCDHHALLLAALLRHRGRPVRVRAGRASYLAPGRWIPHWLCEAWDGAGWRLVDPERRRVAVPAAEWASGGETWLRRRRGEEQGPLASWSGLSGLAGVRYALLCDALALLKNELVGYEWRVRRFGLPKPELAVRGVERLGPRQLAHLDAIAERTLDPGCPPAALWEAVTRALPMESLRCPEPPPEA